MHIKRLLAAVLFLSAPGWCTADHNLTHILQRVNGGPVQLPPVTCRLLIEGGTNATEVRLYETSIARAELECTGGIIRVVIHPLLVPFATDFEGVDITQVGNVVIPANLTGRDRHAAVLQAGRAGTATQTQDRSEAGSGMQPQPINDRCPNATSLGLIGVCGDSWAVFESARITDVPADLSNGVSGFSSLNVLYLTTTEPLLFVDPLFRNVQLSVWNGQRMSGIMVIGGQLEDTRGLMMNAKLDTLQVFYKATFANNWAMVWGGAVTILYGPVDFIDCQFIGNKATTIAEATKGSPYSAFRSGFGGAVLVQNQFTNRAEHSFVRFVGCSFQNNLAYEGGAVALMGASASFDNCTFSNNTAVQNGLDIFSSLGGSLSIKGSSISLASRSVDWQRVNASQCMRGEYFGDRVCRRCAVSTYSLTVPSTQCQPCPPNAQCPGGDAILPTSGHWRVSNESAQVVICPRASTCLEGGTCATGHEGIVCGSCQDGYALTVPFRCVKCQSKGAAVGFFFATLLALLLLAGIGIQLTITANREAAATAASSALGVTSSAIATSGTAQPDPSAGHVLKLLTLFLQYVSILGTLPVPLPPAFLGFTSAASGLFAGGAAWFTSPFECAWQGATVPVPIAKLLVHLSMPLVVAAVELVVFFTVGKAFGRRKKQRLPLTVVLLVSAFFTLPGWVQAVFSFFNCYGIQDPSLTASWWWVPHMAQACYIGYHRTWALSLGVPCLILCCAIPVTMFIALWRNRKRLSQRSFCESYGHLYCLYRTRAFWWECVVLGQTIVLVALSVFATQVGAYVVVLLVGVHFVFALQLLHFLKPYASDVLHWLHVGSLGCLLLDVFVALLMFAQPALPTRTRDIGIGQIVAAFLAVCVNVAFVFNCCMLIVRCVSRGPSGNVVRSIVARCRKGRSDAKPSHTHVPT